MLKIGHRGAAGLAPENTEVAFKKAIKANLDMVEIDVQLSKDNQLIVFHDYDLRRIAGIKKKVSDLKLKELKKIDIGSWFSEQFAQERILTLAEVIELVKGQLQLNIELKILREDYQLVIKKLVKLLEEKSFSQDVIISSFNHQLIKSLKESNPGLKSAILVASLPVNPIRLIEDTGADGIHPHYLTVTEDLVAVIKEAGYMLNTWTVNQRAEIVRLKELGVDGIMTDYPELLI
ncbi:glycerophosphodiester phosphodiesterase [Natroniella sulfidigena]|uniref:glycerophosphodiester phosphodiesterase n=1 Tax=Natroniella sulfidigena TaxID=723921 RepID=UPI00200B18E3|nr:glycerophosphodiester phosphodiesterase family protein [Natroniella sulfidigena]MCK8816858.1 glycerophosphodiester phosphodiesterase [Natroniella sulfidigena]